MADESSEVEQPVRNGDAVINIEPPPTISSKKNCFESSCSSKKSDINGVTTQDPVHALVEKLHALPGKPHVTRPATIFHVPTYSNIMKTQVEPEMVSIGPFHRGKASLRLMENHKLWYLRDFLARKADISNSMEVYLKEMRAMEAEARLCYDDVIDLSAEEFSLMLLLDGCFILEFYLKIVDKELDHIVDVGWNIIDLDLIKIENQIPYSVIHKLASIHFGWELEGCDDHECTIQTFIYNRLVNRYTFVVKKPMFYCSKIDHLLHLYKLCMQPPKKPDNETTDPPTEEPPTAKPQSRLSQFWAQSFSVKARSCLSRVWPKSLSVKTRSCLAWLRSKRGIEKKKKEADILYRMPSATRLSEAGVIFKQKIDPSHPFDITFKDGVLEIPFITIKLGIKTMYINVLLYEQAQNFRTPKNFTSYMLLMDHLIDTSDDAAILIRAGIVQNFLQDDEEVAVFFNQMADYTMINFHKSYYIDVVKDVVNYINLPWHSYKAMLVRNYFGNPWSIISVVAAVILLLLAATQTGFSIIPVVHPSK